MKEFLFKEKNQIAEVEKDLLTPDIMEEAAENMTNEKREMDEEQQNHLKALLLKNFAANSKKHTCGWRDEYKINGMTPA